MTGTRIGQQIFAGFSASLGFVTAGVGLGWSSPALPKLLEDTEVPVTSGQGGWVVSLLIFGAVFGPVVAVFLVDRIGRKQCLLLTAIPNLISWVLIAFATSHEWLYVARFIGGISVGSVFTVTPIYVGEIAQDNIRGGLGALLATMLSFGQLTASIVGPFCSRQGFAAACIIPTLVFVVTFRWMPETPYFLLMKKRGDAAEKSLSRLRGTGNNVRVEFERMAEQVELQQREKGTITELVTVRGNRRATIIVIVLISAQQLSGFGAILAYAGTILEETSSDIDADLSVVIIGFVNLFVGLVTVVISDKVGRKPLLVISSIGASISVFLLAVYFHFQANDVDVSTISWIPTVALLVFHTAINLGLGPLPYVVLSEIYPTSVKAPAAMLVSVYGSVLGAVVIKMYQVIADSWGEHVLLYTFGTIEALFAVCIIFIVYETKCKSLREIHQHFHGTAA